MSKKAAGKEPELKRQIKALITKLKKYDHVRWKSKHDTELERTAAKLVSLGKAAVSYL